MSLCQCIMQRKAKSKSSIRLRGEDYFAMNRNSLESVVGMLMFMTDVALHNIL